MTHQEIQKWWFGFEVGHLLRVRSTYWYRTEEEAQAECAVQVARREHVSNVRVWRDDFGGGS